MKPAGHNEEYQAAKAFKQRVCFYQEDIDSFKDFKSEGKKDTVK